MSLKNLCFATCPRFFVFISIKHLKNPAGSTLSNAGNDLDNKQLETKTFYSDRGRKTDYQLYKMNINSHSLPSLVILTCEL